MILLRRGESRKRWGEGLFIQPTPYISGLCYSVFRVEPYIECGFDCIYCYRRWYTVKGGIKQVWDFERAAAEVRSAGLISVPFRISTLTDPFQPAEEKEKLTLKILEIAARYGYPVVLNTRSTLIAREPWRGRILELAHRGLLILQVSISTITDEWKKLEPNAPPPDEVLNVAGKLAEKDVPLVIRYQPLVPGLSDVDEIAEKAMERFNEVGVQHVIVEYLRTDENALPFYEKIAIDKKPYKSKWEYYGVGGEKGPIKPPIEYRLRKIKVIGELARKKGLKFATCKEGLFSVHTAPDCCGFYLLEARHILRPTLAEAYNIIKQSGSISLEKLRLEIQHLRGFLSGSRVDAYPRPIRKGLRWHEKVFLKILGDKIQLEKVTQELKLKDGELILSALQ